MSALQSGGAPENVLASRTVRDQFDTMRVLLVLPYVGLAAVACVQPPNEPLTAEDRCVILCEGQSRRHPCFGEEAASDCVSRCTAHITPLTGNCLTCVLTHSGWMGQACVCQEVDAFGMLDVKCDACAYTTHQEKCAASSSCQRDTATCDGFELVSPTDPTCVPACEG